MFPVSILNKSITGRYRPVRVADGPITARYRFIKNANWVLLFYTRFVAKCYITKILHFFQAHSPLEHIYTIRFSSTSNDTQLQVSEKPTVGKAFNSKDNNSDMKIFSHFFVEENKIRVAMEYGIQFIPSNSLFKILTISFFNMVITHFL